MIIFDVENAEDRNTFRMKHYAIANIHEQIPPCLNHRKCRSTVVKSICPGRLPSEPGHCPQYLESNACANRMGW
ncbi:hypothetical protein R1CP_40170 (plasmid) [Rhodococcus opacus]|uniref:Uncharacterized protein n=1 Tax=Rhodococcus opacus TaxID=37919 RepID=A0A1B1KJ75_RHOOP|nr:hypothetical protein R1CP_40170 [Rhodococcus opacus]